MQAKIRNEFMALFDLRKRFYLASFVRHDLKASIAIYFVALPLCLAIPLASGAPPISGLLAGVIGGMVISLISKSSLSVSGPAAGLTSICATAIGDLGSFQMFSLAVALAGLLQGILGLLKFGGFTHLIPSSVIRGMLAAIGIILIIKQLPLVVGYDKPDFWQDELFNLFTFRHGFESISGLWMKLSAGAILVAVSTFIMLIVWERKLTKSIPFLPASFVAVIIGTMLAHICQRWFPSIGLVSTQFVAFPDAGLTHFSWQVDLPALFNNRAIWETGIIICLVASLETLLSITAVDKLDRLNRITPQNRELVAQGIGNFFSGFAGGIPITSVIVRSSANVEAGAQSWRSSFLHGTWLLLTILLAASMVRLIPYCVLAVILLRTGYNLARPSMMRSVYRQGREQFLPFAVTLLAILLTDLLIGVLIGIGYAIYFLIKHTYRAGYTVTHRLEGHTRHFGVDLGLNVSFLNKKRIAELLEGMPEYSIIEINGERSIYIDHDVLEIVHAFKTKAAKRHIQLVMKGIPDIPSPVGHE